MSLNLESLTMTRGDTKQFDVTISLDGNQVLEADLGTLRFIAKRKFSDDEILLEIAGEIVGDKIRVTIPPAATEEMTQTTALILHAELEYTHSDASVMTFPALAKGRLTIYPDID